MKKYRLVKLPINEDKAQVVLDELVTDGWELVTASPEIFGGSAPKINTIWVKEVN